MIFRLLYTTIIIHYRNSSAAAFPQATEGQGGERAPGAGIRVRDLRETSPRDNLAQERRGYQAQQLLAAHQRVRVDDRPR